MGRKQVDRYHCAECGADTELIAGVQQDAGAEQTACCRYCGNEITLTESPGQYRGSGLASAWVDADGAL